MSNFGPDHSLPAAPAFSGRESQLASLLEFWNGDSGVATLIGIGGAGKTAIAEQFRNSIESTGEAQKIFVWSFYDDPDVSRFLKSAHDHFVDPEEEAIAKGGWLAPLIHKLADGGKYMLILDGLERVQRQQTDALGMFGQLEDTMLAGLLVRICGGLGRSKALLTSRFPVSTLEKWNRKGYEVIDVSKLSGEAAYKLIRSQGVSGSNEELDRVIELAGGHALTIDLLAGATARFFNGSPQNLPEIQIEGGSKDRQGARLKAVLQIYENRLSEPQVDLLKCLCVFRFGATPKSLLGIFGGDQKSAIAGNLSTAEPQDIEKEIDYLIKCHLVHRESNDRLSVHPTVRDHFYRLFRNPSTMHEAIQDHLTVLTHRPGIALPDDRASLDLLEELIHHALEAGSLRDAIDVYFSRMGGSEHLNTKLGEFARTFRILSEFENCPDVTGLYQCLRAFARIDEALKLRPQNRYLLLLRGKLHELADDSSTVTSAIAQALMGEDVPLPDRTPDFPIPSGLVYLLRKDYIEAERVIRAELRSCIHEDDRARNRLLLSDALRQNGKSEESRVQLESASTWILPSNSIEHLCLLNWVRGRFELSLGQFEHAERDLEEAERIASESDYPIFEALAIQEVSKVKARRGDDNGFQIHKERSREVAASVGFNLLFQERVGDSIRN